ncbi:phage baseplate assembly protein V [Kribbella sp. CA-293567]|uniref:phage baseplate assembly protein V n=1 Tax=Kribbella sp. CA-293567 TaxID=3002436 RepID=UPI0022DE76D2|nr:phage baseplate assembly protein V [Kribbella sp. CA-293567]WBQ06498.1 phage baseplate assembly protein V [Kribbella sp. CA-293567]
MTVISDRPADGTAAVPATVYLGVARRPLAAELADSIVRVVVDQQLRLPGMFEVVFDDRGALDRLLTQLAIGTEVGIAAASPLRPGDPRLLMTGEVTAIEADYGETAFVTVRGYSHEHRLQRARRSRTFVNMSDADIARKIAREAGLTIGEITPTRVVHEHLGQVNQTDWEFLSARAAAIGCDFGVAQGKFFFGDRTIGAPVRLMLLSNLLAFAPRITAGNLAPEAEVRVWDPLAAKVVSERADVTMTGTATGTSAGPRLQPTVAKVNDRPGPVAGGRQAGANLGPRPSDQATVLADRPIGSGNGIGQAARAMAAGLADRLGGTFAEAVGESVGDPWLSDGRIADISGVAAPFAGQWKITRARHELAGGRYRTRFEVTGAQDRSLLGLAQGGRRRDDRVAGVVCGIVTNNVDPLGKGRVKLVLPWLSPEYETNWASVVQPGAGENSGALVLPDPGDEVMVGFEFGDLQRPYVLGGIVNNRSTYSLGAPAVKANGATGVVQWRGLVAPSGNRLAFHDEAAGPARFEQGEILLGSGDGKVTLRIDQVAGVVAVNCLPNKLTRPGEKGRIVIECGPGGAIELVAGEGGSVTIDGGASLSLKAQRLNLEGAQITVNGTGPVEVKGKPIKLN